MFEAAKDPCNRGNIRDLLYDGCVTLFNHVNNDAHTRTGGALNMRVRLHYIHFSENVSFISSFVDYKDVHVPITI